MNNNSTLKGFFLPKDFGGNFTSIDVAPNLARFYRGKIFPLSLHTQFFALLKKVYNAV